MTPRKLTRCVLAIGSLAALAAPLAATAATGAQVDAAIDKGLAYLAATQASGGNWSYWGGAYDQAATAAAAFAMLSQKSQWGSHAAAYQGDVDKAMQYLLATASTATVSTRWGDATNICPGGSGTCTAVYWYGSNEATYTTGQVAAAVATYAAGHAGDVATTSGPLANMTWGQIAQGIVNTFAAAQSAVHNYSWGGWRYGLPSNNDADSSTTQWASIAMLYGRTLGATVPAVTVTDLATHWLPNVQAADGSACYQPGSSPCDHADTGGMLLALDFAGVPASNAQVQKALAFLNSNWKASASGTWYGNFGHPYAMWAEYKGLELTIGLADNSHITNLLGCGTLDAGVNCNWWQDYNEWLVNHQQADGGWGGYDYWADPLATAYYLPILGGVLVPDGNDAPEPATFALVGTALAGLAVVRRRRRT